MILLQLAARHTPIHPWKLPGLPKSFQLSVKRDDMTGSTLSGNKVRLHKEVVYYKCTISMHQVVLLDNTCK